MRFITTAFLENIQIDEFDCVIPNEAMFDLFEDDWDSMTESDMEEWILIED